MIILLLLVTVCQGGGCDNIALVDCYLLSVRVEAVIILLLWIAICSLSGWRL